MQAPPFKTYYPSPDSMDRQQKQFYRHFKCCIEKGEFVDVAGQVSYVFCYAYEVIDYKKPRRTLIMLGELAKIYANDPILPAYLNTWAADCCILLGELDKALELLPEPQLGTAWGLNANTRLGLKHELRMAPTPRELIAIVGPKVTKYGRDNLSDVEHYLGVQLSEMHCRSQNLISKWISQYQIKRTAFRPFNGIPNIDQQHNDFAEYHFSNCEVFRDFVGDFIRQAENALRVDKGLPRIGEGWISETQLYYQLKDMFKDHQVLQHARPPWLGRQHLDVYLPELSVAVEFQGAQHDRPIEFFGGQRAFEENQKRDKRKRAACKRNNITLLEVRDGYNIDDLVSEIEAIHK